MDGNTEVIEQVIKPVIQEPVSLGEEDKARLSGWKPQEEWEGNPEEWIDARTFNKNGEYIEHIKSLSSENKKAQKKLAKLEKEFATLAEHHSKVAQIEREKAMKELKAARKEAFSVLDMDKVEEIESRMDDLRDEEYRSKNSVKETGSQSNPAVDAWMEQNTWYGSDELLTAAANGLIQQAINKDPSRSEDAEGVLEEVALKLKKEFPNKFGTARTRTTSATLESGSEGQAKPVSYARRLNDQQRRIGETFVRQGAIKNLEEYAKQLHEIGEIK